MCNVSCPSDLRLAHDGDDAGDFRTLKNFSVRDFVLPPDVKEVLKAPEMEMVHLTVFHGVCRQSMFRSLTVG